MESYVFLLSIAIILLSTKFLGDAINKVNMTQVVGALLAGVLLGPSCFGLIKETDFLAKTAEMFPPMVLMVIATTVITPVVLRKIMNNDDGRMEEIK